MMREKVRERGRERGREWAREKAFSRATKENRWAGRDTTENRPNTRREKATNTTSFFFANFPDYTTVEDLWKRFQRWGRVTNIYIASRRNKNGWRFGFVSFADVKHIGELEKDLDSMWIGDFKLRVNIPRFGKPDQQRRRKDEGKEKRRDEEDQQKVQADRRQDVRGNGKHVSYLSALTSTTKVNQVQQQAKVERTNATNSGVALVYKTTGENKSWLQKSFIGELIDIDDVEHIQTKLYAEGFYTIKASTLGGKKILLSADEDESIEDIIHGESAWFQRWFTYVKRWNAGVNMGPRQVWVQCWGIPLIAWEEGLFKSITSPFGSFVKCDLKTLKKQRLDVGRVLLTTSSLATIDLVIKVDINGVQQDIKVREEPLGFEKLQSRKGRMVTRYGGSEAVSSDSEEKWNAFHGVEWPEEEGDGGREEEMMVVNSNFISLSGNKDIMHEADKEKEGCSVATFMSSPKGFDRDFSHQPLATIDEELTSDTDGSTRGTAQGGSQSQKSDLPLELEWAVNVSNGCRKAQMEKEGCDCFNAQGASEESSGATSPTIPHLHATFQKCNKSITPTKHLNVVEEEYKSHTNGLDQEKNLGWQNSQAHSGSEVHLEATGGSKNSQGIILQNAQAVSEECYGATCQINPHLDVTFQKCNISLTSTQHLNVVEEEHTSSPNGLDHMKCVGGQSPQAHSCGEVHCEATCGSKSPQGVTPIKCYNNEEVMRQTRHEEQPTPTNKILHRCYPNQNEVTRQTYSEERSPLINHEGYLAESSNGPDQMNFGEVKEKGKGKSKGTKHTRPKRHKQQKSSSGMRKKPLDGDEKGSLVNNSATNFQKHKEIQAGDHDLRIVLDLMDPVEEAKQIWKIGKTLGVTSMEQDKVNVGRLLNLQISENRTWKSSENGSEDEIEPDSDGERDEVRNCKSGRKSNEVI